ncbi:unnamed protein product [Calypogeia fissa]
MLRGSSSRSQESHGSSEIVKENDSVYQLYKPAGTPSVQVVLFHGLQPGPYSDAHLSSWKSEDDSCIWPQTWLVEEIPEAQVFSVSCDGVLRNSSNASIDMYNLAENLISDLLMANVGQVSNCPIVLVGHSIGGLVIKELCCQAHSQLSMNRDFQTTKLEKFLTNLRGVFYFATPHHGSPVANRMADMVGSPLMKYFKTLSTDTARLNSTFDGIRKVYEKWQFASLGEDSPTNLGWLGKDMVVPEASVREDNFNVVQGADHYSICRPRSKTSRSFYKLKDFLVHIATSTANEVKDDAHPQILQRLPKHVTGIDGQIEQVKAILKDNRTVGLVGMGGLGKTTLAKAIFNELCASFEYTCFVHDVKHISGTVDIVKDQVWSHMNWKGKKVGKADSISWSGKEVIIVLDDISSDRDENVLLDIAHLTSSKSRFIVTCREQDSLQRLDIIYKVKFLKENSAESLFKMHAFPDQVLPIELVDLTKAIVTKSEGLPLALEVLGQYLKSVTDVEVWEQVVHSLDKPELASSLNERMWEKLMPSYNALEENAKQMFLDAATIFYGGFDYDSRNMMGFSLREVQAAWREAYGVNERLLWKTLVDRSLVYDVGKDDCIAMHEQLRSLGRKVAKEAFKDGLCRVWEETTALQLLQITDNTEEDISDIHALRLRCQWKSIDIAGRALRRLKNARFLVMEDNVKIAGPQANELFPSKLVLLRCVGTQLLKPAAMSHLVVLFLVDYTQMVLPSSIGQLSALRFFHLDAPLVYKLPDKIGNLSQLEGLHLHNCRNLRSLPKTFGELTRLKCLGFYTCEGLLALPTSFGHLPALEHLKFHYCTELRALPESFGLLHALEHLEFRSCPRLLSLPKSFGCLTALQELVFRQCGQLHALPESFGHLSALNHLQFDTCEKLQSLPESFGNLSALHRLEFYDCSKLHSLPQSFGLLCRSVDLTLRGCDSLETLPECFGHFSAHSRLEFYRFSKLRSLPESFGLLSTLVDLKFTHCDSLETLPESFGHLSALTHLQYYNCNKLQSFPKSFGLLSSLVDLQVSFCDSLETLPESFGHLSSLNHLQFVNCRKLKSLPESFGQLSALCDLTFSECECLETLPDSFWRLVALRNLTLRFMVLTLPESFGQLSGLSNLTLEYCGLQGLPESFGSLSSLSHLRLYYCHNLHLLPESFGQLRSLQSLKIYVHQKGLGKLANAMATNSLSYLIHSCAYMETIPDYIKDMHSLLLLEVGIESDQSVWKKSCSRWMFQFDSKRKYKIAKEFVEGKSPVNPRPWLN